MGARQGCPARASAPRRPGAGRDGGSPSPAAGSVGASRDERPEPDRRSSRPRSRARGMGLHRTGSPGPRPRRPPRESSPARKRGQQRPRSSGYRRPAGRPGGPRTSHRCESAVRPCGATPGAGARSARDRRPAGSGARDHGGRQGLPHPQGAEDGCIEPHDLIEPSDGAARRKDGLCGDEDMGGLGAQPTGKRRKALRRRLRGRRRRSGWFRERRNHAPGSGRNHGSIICLTALYRANGR